jgi:TonB family protein
MICSNCGANLKPQDLSCPFCGYTSDNLAEENSNHKTESTPPRVPKGEKELSLKDLIEKNLQNPQTLSETVVQSEKKIVEKPKSKIDQNAGTKTKTFEKTVNRKPFFISLAVIIVLAVITISVNFYLKSETVESGEAIFMQAEQLFNSEDYKEALRLYENFVENSPNNPNVSIAKNRIKILKKTIFSGDNLNDEANRKKTIQSLMKKAEEAYQKGHYLYPTDINTIYYVNQILEFDPDYSPILFYRDKIIAFYTRRARQAIEAKEYSTAVGHYENILKILPEDQLAKSNYTMAVELQKLSEQPNNSSQNNSNEKKSLSRIIDTLLTPGKNKDISQSEPLNKRSDESNSPNLNEPKLENPSLEKLATRESSLPLQNMLPPASSLSLEINSNSEVPLIIEALIDGGKRKYVHREKPSIPDWLTYEGTHTVRVENIVDVNGKVESVRVLLSSNIKELDYYASKAFKRFEYQPATQRGKPVRFRVVELMTFK